MLFTRFPVAGKSKTRLIPALGEHEAAMLQKKMTEHIVAMLQTFDKQADYTLEVRYTGAGRKEIKNWLAASSAMTFNEQGKGDLGARLSRAFAAAFRGGNDQVLAIGADCPALTTEILENGFKLLEVNDVVLGPAIDGGYYLIGMRGYWPELFSQIAWGSEHVLAQTCASAAQAGLMYALLQPLTDIDRPEDLRHCRDIPS